MQSVSQHAIETSAYYCPDYRSPADKPARYLKRAREMTCCPLSYFALKQQHLRYYNRYYNLTSFNRPDSVGPLLQARGCI
jgi:hypothetical protein